MEIAQFSRATIGSAQIDRVKRISHVDVLVEDTKGTYILHMQDSGANLLRPQNQQNYHDIIGVEKESSVIRPCT